MSATCWLGKTVLLDRAAGVDRLGGGTSFSEGMQRIVSWQIPRTGLRHHHPAPAPDALGRGHLLHRRHPDRLPIGIISAYKQYSAFDQGHLLLDGGLLHPTFFTGMGDHHLLGLDTDRCWWWFPSSYDTTHVVNDWDSFVFQLQQMVMPMMVLALYNAAQISRYMRASMLDNLQQDYVRTARAKGMGEASCRPGHVLRNSLIPVVTVIALNVPAVFGGALITEQVFRVNGIGYQLIQAI
jgi:peptide/nickel transport system permease protein